TKQAQDEIAKAQAIIDNAPDAPEPLAYDEVLAALTALRDLPELLDAADTQLRADVYRSLGLELTYRRENGAEFIQVQASLRSVDLERVGGGTSTMSTPALREVAPLLGLA